MKFSHKFSEALRKEGFPPQWVEVAVHYGQLKKCIKKVQSELKCLGLDSETLALLNTSTSSSELDFNEGRRGSRELSAFKYGFTEESKTFRPKLILFIKLRNGVVIDATLSLETRKYLEGLADSEITPCLPPAAPATILEATFSPSHIELNSFDKNILSSTQETETDRIVLQQIEVPLRFDAEFFGLLKSEVSSLDALQAGEEKSFTEQINCLGKEVAKVASPSRFSKTDLNRWREIFDLYLQAGVFFSTNELDHGSRDSKMASRQLQWFQKEIASKGLAKSFKLKASRDALERFNRINMLLLQNLKFQEINQIAVWKILKKFDKQTALGAKNTFPKLIATDRIMSQSMAKAVCAAISNEIVKIVPQLDDYLCPVCFSISWRPVRLACRHVFCIRCVIQMQRSRSKYCPLCRNNVVMDANTDNLDDSMADFLLKYFPKETKVKQKENELAAGIDRFGPVYADAQRCVIM